MINRLIKMFYFFFKILIKISLKHLMEILELDTEFILSGEENDKRNTKSYMHKVLE